MKRTNYKAMSAQLNAQLNALNQRRKVRVLNSSDVDLAIATLKRARRMAPDACNWLVTVKGGIVCSSYNNGMGGLSDTIILVCYAAGTFEATAGRGRATRRANGAGPTLIAVATRQIADPPLLALRTIRLISA